MKILAYFICFFILAQQAWALQSNQVPTAELEAHFYVFWESESKVKLSVSLIYDGSYLEISPDERITFNLKSDSVNYDDLDQTKNALPLSYDDLYSVTFTRANGEIYTSQVLLPKPATFNIPEGAAFQKGTEVIVTWTFADPRDIVAAAYLLFPSECTDSSHDIYTDWSYTFSAKFAEKCQTLPAVVPFGITTGRLQTLSGLNGYFAGLNYALLKFSYF